MDTEQLVDDLTTDCNLDPMDVSGNITYPVAIRAALEMLSHPAYANEVLEMASAQLLNMTNRRALAWTGKMQGRIILNRRNPTE